MAKFSVLNCIDQRIFGALKRPGMYAASDRELEEYVFVLLEIRSIVAAGGEDETHSATEKFRNDFQRFTSRFTKESCLLFLYDRLKEENREAELRTLLMMFVNEQVPSPSCEIL